MPSMHCNAAVGCAAIVVALTAAGALAPSAATTAAATPAQTYWTAFTDGNCDELGTLLASDFDWAATNITTPTGYPLTHYSPATAVPFCKETAPGGSPLLQVDWDTDVWTSYESGTWSKITFPATFVAGPPMVRGGTANCTVTFLLDETMIVDEDGKCKNAYDLDSNPKEVSEWMNYCTTGTAFPKPDASPSADIQKFVTDWSNAWNTGNCDTFGAFLAENYTQALGTAGPANKAEAIAGCKANKLGDTAALSMFTTSMYTVGTDTVAANYVMSASAKDPTTLQQCSVRAKMNARAHTFIDPTTGTRVVDTYSETQSRDVRGDIVRKCHLG